MINDKADEVTEKLVESLLSRYRIGLETPLRGGNFTFDYIHLLYYKCRKIILQCGKLYIDSSDWIKKVSTHCNTCIKS